MGVAVERDEAGLLAVYRARLPPADAVLPYLRRIDEKRHYANRGPLVELLETRLGVMIAGRGCAVMTAASGTAALQAAILAQAGRATKGKDIALMPAYTFVATAMAAEACGYRPVFVDLDAADGTSGVARFRDHPALARAGVVIAVAPYGRPHRQAEWADFAAEAHVPVVIDAAASFEALARDATALTGPVPVVVSFHATKAFSTGEGGAVIWSDLPGLARVAQALNFGFLWTRESRAAGFNGKMSEYHAAVGLAGLDCWDETAAGYALVNARYRVAAEAAGLGDRVVVGPEIASNYALALAASDDEATAMLLRLAASKVEHRYWYGAGVHREPYFVASGTPALAETAAFARRLIGIPIFPDMKPNQIERVIRCLASACQ